MEEATEGKGFGSPGADISAGSVCVRGVWHLSARTSSHAGSRTPGPPWAGSRREDAERELRSCFPAPPFPTSVTPLHAPFRSLCFPPRSTRAAKRINWPNRLFWYLLMWQKESCKNQYILVPTWRHVIASNTVIWLMFSVLSLDFSRAPHWDFVSVHNIHRKLSDKEYAVNSSYQANQNEMQYLLVE